MCVKYLLTDLMQKFAIYRHTLHLKEIFLQHYQYFSNFGHPITTLKGGKGGSICTKNDRFARYNQLKSIKNHYLQIPTNRRDIT